MARASIKGRGRDAFLPTIQPVIKVETSGAYELSISELWLDDQPRRLVPDEVLLRLIAEGRAHPAALLEELKSVAPAHPYYGTVLQALETLARTIASDGVLEPLLVVQKDGRYVLRDGHRRSLASLIAGKETAPARVIDEASELQSTARSLVVNIQRADLTALEKGRWLHKLARLVEDEIRTDQGVVDGPSVVDALVAGAVRADESSVPHVWNGDADPDASDSVPHVWNGETPRSASTAERALAVAVRSRVLELTGLGRSHYYNLLYLNRLTPEAQEAGLGLAEGQLRPVTSLPGPDQATIVRFIAERRLTSKEAATLVGVAKSGDRDAVRRVMQKLAKEEVKPSRAAVSWEGLLHALPQDLSVRVSSLRAELAALPAERRAVRVRSLQEQSRLATEFVQQIAEIVALYGETESAVGSDEA